MKDTKFLTKEEAAAGRKWHVVDVAGLVPGRIATEIATLLRGKHKPQFTPHNDCGDFVVVTNADKVKFTGNKLKQKLYQHHTGFVGGIKTRTAEEMFIKNPERVISKAVERMLPKNKLGKQLLTKLKVYTGPDHPHAAQKPEVYQAKFTK